MIAYEIQTVRNGQWTNDVTLLGDSLDQSANRWGTESEALAAMDELIKLWPEERSRLRVVAADV
jgi:hypothetical protein